MPNISDRKLRSAYAELQAQFEADSSVKIDGSNALGLLATVADTLFTTIGGARKKLEAASTRAEQLEIVKNGLTRGEKRDLGALLDSGSVPFSPEWRNFFEAAIGRATLAVTPTNTDTDPNAPLKITGDFSSGFISGVAAPGVTIEAINLTTAPAGRLHADDTLVLAVADASGKFSGRLSGPQLDGTKTGDLIRMRTRDKNGNVSGWVDVRATGLGASDTRNAIVALFRIGLTQEAGGKIAVTNINASRPLSEPGSTLQLTNKTTGEKTVVTIDSQGQLPADLKIKGKNGDVIAIAVSDGVNNVNYAKAEGEITVGAVVNEHGGVDLVDPSLHSSEAGGNFQVVRFTGPLFVNEPTAGDVLQGQIGNCYFPSAMAAIAHADPEAIKRLIRENDDGSYTVSFLQRNWSTGKYVKKEISVDGDLYARAWGGPLYGTSAGEKSPKAMELWYPLVEKAYAMLKGGSYEDIGNGGVAGHVMSAVLGRDNFQQRLGKANEAKAWQRITAAVDNKLPAALGTQDDEAFYKNTGIYANHSYSVLGYKTEGGKKFVQIRNPWGESEPAGNGANDGVFWLSLEDTCRLFDSLDYVK